jgi:hypothetical protein
MTMTLLLIGEPLANASASLNPHQLLLEAL